MKRHTGPSPTSRRSRRKNRHWRFRARLSCKLYAVVVVAPANPVSLVRRAPVRDVTGCAPRAAELIRGAPAYLFVDWAADGNFRNFVFCLARASASGQSTWEQGAGSDACLRKPVLPRPFHDQEKCDGEESQEEKVLEGCEQGSRE